MKLEPKAQLRRFRLEVVITVTGSLFVEKWTFPNANVDTRGILTLVVKK